MEVYETSNTTLRSILSNPTLGREHVTRTTDDLADTIADQQEIEDAIRTGGAIASAPAAGEIDEDDLTAELDAMVKDETERKELERMEGEKAQAAAAAKQNTPAAQVPAETLALEEELQRKAKILGMTAEKASTSGEVEQIGVDEQREWEQRYGDAQQRQRGERQRAEDERRRREAGRVAAE